MDSRKSKKNYERCGLFKKKDNNNKKSSKLAQSREIPATYKYSILSILHE